jgi:hypothetical protein
MQGHKNTERIQWSEKAAETEIETNRGYAKYYISNDVKSSLCRSQAEGHLVLTEITKKFVTKVYTAVSVTFNLFRTCIRWVTWSKSDFGNNVGRLMNAVLRTKEQTKQICWQTEGIFILIRPRATQSKSARFRCFFFLFYFTTCFGLTDHHQVCKVCLRSLLCFHFDVLYAPRCSLQGMLRHGKHVVRHNITWMKHLEASNTSKWKHSRLLKHTLHTWWWPVRPKHVVK